VRKVTDSWPRTAKTFKWNKGQIFRTLPASSPLATKGSVFKQNDIYYYVVDSGRGRDCRAAILKSPDDYFWQTKLIDLRSCDPSGGVVPNLPVPILPSSGARYIWDSKEDSDRLPPKSSDIQIDNGAHVIVRRASWSKTPVQNESGSPSFLVYTHHLKQFTQY